MKTINQLSVQTAFVAGFVLLASLLSFNSAHALSCLNPTEMIDRYVSEDTFSIALVTAGELETEGAEHDQSVVVKENLKGSTDTSVSFVYDETWQYLCAGQPAEAGTEVVYVTNKTNVIQVITLDSPLYESLMSALSDTPSETETVTNPPVTTDAKQSLMQKIINLLQQMIGLLTGSESTPPTVEPEPVATPEALIGMTTAEAEAYAATNDIMFRVVEVDGEPQEVTEDYRPGRINASVESDVVVSYTVEGEEMTEEDAGPHDDIIGMTQVEAEAYATTNDVTMRIGRIDQEYFPLTMDLRPDRITIEIEEGVVVDYSMG